MVGLPQVGSGGYEIKHLCRIEQLLEPAEELYTLIVPRLGVDEDEERGTVLRPYCLPCFITTCATVRAKLNPPPSEKKNIFLMQWRCLTLTIGWALRGVSGDLPQKM